MLTRLRLVLLLALSLLTPMAAASAQQSTRIAPAAGPRLDVTAVAMQPPQTEQAAMLQARTNSMGRPMALMLVGGAALVLGLVIGDDVGTLFSIAGAVAFLYGLYLYLR
jgi:hypothetical protein